MATVRANLLTLHNNRRAAISKTALTLNSSYNQGADYISSWFASKNYFPPNDGYHTRPNGQHVFDWWDKYYPESLDYPMQGIGENLAAGYATSTDVFNAWMASTDHKANIEKTSYRRVGFGLAASSSGRNYWTAHFATNY